MSVLDSLDMSELGLDLQPTAPSIITCTVEGVLTEQDVANYIASQGSMGTSPAPADDLKRIRERHHAVARSIASGMPQSLVADLHNYTQAYLSTMLNTPSMQELVSYYRAAHGNASMVVAEKLRTVGLKAVEKLEEQMDTKEGLGAQELLGLAKLGLDRSGHGPTSTTVSYSETRIVDEAKLAELNRTARMRDAGRIVSPAEVRRALPAPEGEN